MRKRRKEPVKQDVKRYTSCTANIGSYCLKHGCIHRPVIRGKQDGK